VGKAELRIVLQRVGSASVTVDGKVVGKIGKGFLILLGIEGKDGQTEMDWGVRKVAELRVFQDEQEKMNLSLEDIGGEALVVSQFTLCADVQKGRRPSFVKAAPPEQAEPLYEYFVDKLRDMGIRTATGIFAAKMSVSLVNEGPVTILLER
jgi:D-tyrosyl-tRNA(Tyr) deacylase